MRISDWSSDVCSSDLATVTYPAGYAPEEVPVALVQAMLLLIGHSFSNREAVSVGNTGSEIPLGVESLCIRHRPVRSEEHTSELQSLMRISYAVFCLKKKKKKMKYDREDDIN